eukprot:SAG11_NODE_882_length_6739_cov_1.990211_2_plen_1077_part_00
MYGQGCEIYCEISNGEIKGTRQILFGSSVALRNATNVEIEVLIEEPETQSSDCQDEVIQVAPGALAYVGMRFTQPASRSTLRVRSVVFGEESQWSNELNFHRSLQNNRTYRRDLVCTYEDEAKASFCVSAAMVQNDFNLRTIRFHPKLVIENLLPVALDYRFIERSGGRIMAMADESVGKLCGIMIDEKGDLLANEMSADSHHMESFVEWRLQVKIGDHENWSENVSISEGLNLVSVFDEAEEPLEVVIFGKLENQASLRISVSCPYWIVNKTEDELHTRPGAVGPRLGLTRRQAEERRRLQEQVKKLYPDHMAPFSCDRSRFSVHVPGFDWSPGIRLNAVGTTDFHLEVSNAGEQCGEQQMLVNGDLELGSQGFTGKKGCHVGVSIQRGSGPLAGTKIFTFTPFFRIDNQTGEDLIIRQRYQDRHILLRADMHALAFEWSDTRSSRRVQVKFAEDDWNWSGGIDIQGYIGEFFVPLSLRRHRNATKMRTRDYIIRCEVKNTEQSTHEAMRMIVFYKEDLKFPPYLILNACQQDLCLRQLETDRVVVVQAGLVRPYACEEPFLPHLIECWIDGAETASLRLIADQVVDIDVTNTTTAVASVFSRKALRVSVDCSGPVTRVRVEVIQSSNNKSELPAPLIRPYPISSVDDDLYMRAPDKESRTRMRHIKRRILIGAKDLALEGGGYVQKKGREMISGFKIAPIGHANERDSENDRILLSLGARLESVRVSLIGVVDTPAQQTGDETHNALDDTAVMQSGRREILLLVLDKVRIKVETDDTQQRAELCVRYLQVDNQSHKNKFPVLLSIATEDENHDCVVVHVDRAEFNDRIEYFDYAAVQISDLMHIQLEEEWILSTATFLKSWQERVFNPTGGAAALETQQGAQSGLSVLFGMRGDENTELPQRKNLYFDILRLEPVRIRLDVSTNSGDDDNMLSLPDMNNLRMRFNEMQLKSPYGSADHIVKDLLQSYRRQFLRKLYKVVGSVLPQEGFIVNFGRGLYECVHMPILMARRDLELFREGHYLQAVAGMGCGPRCCRTFASLVHSVDRSTTCLSPNHLVGYVQACPRAHPRCHQTPQ